MVSMRDWQDSVLLGLVQTDRVSQRDFICQSCGTVLVVRPRWRRGMLAALLFLPMAALGAVGMVGGTLTLLNDGHVAGLVFSMLIGLLGTALLVWASVPSWQLRNSPVVPGAPVPEIRYRSLEPIPHCTCGEATLCTKVVANRTNGIPSGVERTYVCNSCGRSWVIESLGGMTGAVFGGLLLGDFVAGLLLRSEPQDWEEMAWEGFVALIGVGLIGLSMTRLLARLRHPVITGRSAR